MTEQVLIDVDSTYAGGGRAWLRWVVWLAVASACAVGLRNYRIDNNLGACVPRLRARSPVRSYAVVGFERGSVDERLLADRLRSLSVVAFCVDRQSVESGGRLVGVTADEFVIGPDGDYAGIFVFPHVEAGDERFVGAIRDILDQTECSRADCFNLGGPAVFHVALNEASQRYPPHIVLLILFVGGALMWAVTRGLAAAGSAMAAITLSQVVLVGAMSWSRLPMDVSLSMVPPLMMSFGFSYAAHRALRPHIAHLLFLCAANTALGFGTFVSADVPPVRIFAVAGGLGLAVVWLAVVTLVPGPRGRSGVEADHAREPFLVPTAQHILARHSRVVVGAALVVKRQGSTVPK